MDKENPVQHQTDLKVNSSTCFAGTFPQGGRSWLATVLMGWYPPDLKEESYPLLLPCQQDMSERMSGCVSETYGSIYQYIYKKVRVIVGITRSVS